MEDPSLGRKKKKITITVSLEGVEVAERALIRLGFDSRSNFAKSQLLARSTVTKFFQGESIQLDSFKRICEALKLNWREIALMPEQEQLGELSRSDSSSSMVNQRVESRQTTYTQVTVINKQSKTVKIEIRLTGHINSVDNLKILELVLQEYSGDTIEITDIKEGSIRLFVEGSPENIERLVSRIKSGELKTVTGFPVEDVQILSESSDDEESTESDEKWRLVQEIVSQGAIRRDLSSADLSDADLSSAALISANLSLADLSHADLSNADLRYADLIGADLRNADLRNADLRNADLRNADLRNANLRNANLGHSVIDETTIITNKWLLVWEIVNHPSDGRDLSHADLSNADLRNADLSNANLNNANLSLADLSLASLKNADLSNADLRNADLSRADLSDADLSRANLRDATLISANLSGANLIAANVVNAFFGYSIGLTEDMKRDLEQRGAIFGDRPPVLSQR